MKVKTRTEEVERKHYLIESFGDEDSVSLKCGPINLTIRKNIYTQGLDFYPEGSREPCLCLNPRDCITIPFDAGGWEMCHVSFIVIANDIDKVRELLKGITYIAPARELKK